MKKAAITAQPREAFHYDKLYGILYKGKQAKEDKLSLTVGKLFTK